jgi:hypothetical protein
MMTKLVRLMATLILAGVLLVAIAGPASALSTTDPTACWNNCGIGDPKTVY